MIPRLLSYHCEPGFASKSRAERSPLHRQKGRGSLFSPAPRIKTTKLRLKPASPHRIAPSGDPKGRRPPPAWGAEGEAPGALCPRRAYERWRNSDTLAMVAAADLRRLHTGVHSATSALSRVELHARWMRSRSGSGTTPLRLIVWDVGVPVPGEARLTEHDRDQVGKYGLCLRAVAHQQQAAP